MKKAVKFGLGVTSLALLAVIIFLFVRPEYRIAMQHGAGPDERVALFTELLAIVTFILAVVSASQIIFLMRQDERLIASIDEAKKANVAATDSARAATKSANLMENTTKMQLRCYLAIASATEFSNTKASLIVTSGQSQNVTVKLNFFVINNGLTPAYNLRSSVYVDIAPPSEDDRLSASSELDKHPKSNGTVNPSEVISVDRQFNEVFSSARLAEFNNGKHRCYIYGKLEFTDAFNERRWVKFQYFIKPGRVVHDKYQLWEISEHGNYTSENADPNTTTEKFL